MKTDMWMPWYIADYLRDTMHLSTEQHGAYLLLIAHYWVHGPIPDNQEYLANVTRLMLVAWSKHCSSISKFFQIHDGFWHHKRIDAELAIAKKNKERCVTRAKTAASKRWKEKEGDASSMPQAMLQACPKHVPSPTPSPIIAEREYAQPSFAESPGWKEVQMHAGRLGLAEWKAKDWFDEMEGCGWLDHQKRPIAKWQHVLNRVCRKWEADGRPMQPPSHATGNNGGGGNGKPTFWANTKQLELVNAEIKAIEERNGGDAFGVIIGPKDRELYGKLKMQRSDLKRTLGIK